MSISDSIGGSATDPAVVSDLIAAAFRDHSAAIHGTALRSTRDPELAADVTQEAFMRLLAEARAGRYPANVGGWLYRATANLIVSRARRAAVARRFAPRLARYDGPPEPDDVAIHREGHHTLQRALASLGTIERVALIMAADGATGEEIASHLGRTNGATRTLLCRARVRLRAEMIRIDEPRVERAARPVLLAGIANR